MMSKPDIRRLLTWLRSRFLVSETGVSAMEFALLLPIMLTVYLGGFSLSQAISCYQLTQLANGTVLNIVAQYTTLSQTAQWPDIAAASKQVMRPFNSSLVTITVTEICIDNTGKSTVCAIANGVNGSPTAVGPLAYQTTAVRTPGAAITIPAAFDTPATTAGSFNCVLLSETSYAYTPPIQYINFGTFNLKSSVYMVPRASACINIMS
jgi:Flp pilus assembly protein TadG